MARSDGPRTTGDHAEPLPVYRRSLTAPFYRGSGIYRGKPRLCPRVSALAVRIRWLSGLGNGLNVRYDPLTGSGDSVRGPRSLATDFHPAGKAFDLEFGQTTKWDGGQLIIISACWDAAWPGAAVWPCPRLRAGQPGGRQRPFDVGRFTRLHLSASRATAWLDKFAAMPEIHGHRGARALRPENTLSGLAHALAIGVDALEFDVTLTADGGLILAHDLVVSAQTILDTTPATQGDPDFPYVGKAWSDTHAAADRHPGCGRPALAAPFEATFQAVPGAGVPTLIRFASSSPAWGRVRSRWRPR